LDVQRVYLNAEQGALEHPPPLSAGAYEQLADVEDLLRNGVPVPRTLEPLGFLDCIQLVIAFLLPSYLDYFSKFAASQFINLVKVALEATWLLFT